MVCGLLLLYHSKRAGNNEDGEMTSSDAPTLVAAAPLLSGRLADRSHLDSHGDTSILTTGCAKAHNMRHNPVAASKTIQNNMPTADTREGPLVLGHDSQ
jgi:hypothetical protein